MEFPGPYKPPGRYYGQMRRKNSWSCPSLAQGTFVVITSWYNLTSDLHRGGQAGLGEVNVGSIFPETSQVSVWLLWVHSLQLILGECYLVS